ncbi:MAG: PHP domain-containing protein [Oscillospiraceae bacterium]|nr:PHP domain-containing protein [Oscillospiraceae bacterium]
MNGKQNFSKAPAKTDLHMHSVFSDGTDTPDELLSRVRAAGIGLFSVTDHDSIESSRIMPALCAKGGTRFLSGVEFSCRDQQGQYHILGYGYDPDAQPIQELVARGHSYRMKKLRRRLDFLEQEFGFTFPEEEVRRLYAMHNPGKPHIGNLMVQCGFAESKEQAIREYLNRLHEHSDCIPPGDAIRAILESGGIPVLAHPAFGSGDQMIRGGEMEQRLTRLTASGLQGMECFYSQFSAEIREEMLAFAARFGLYVTAGSDYHGTNKQISLGDTGLGASAELPEGMQRFLHEIEGKCAG